MMFSIQTVEKKDGGGPISIEWKKSFRKAISVIKQRQQVLSVTVLCVFGFCGCSLVAFVLVSRFTWIARKTLDCIRQKEVLATFVIQNLLLTHRTVTTTNANPNPK